MGGMPPVFLKSPFVRNAFWEICFCVIIQVIRNIFGPALAEFSREPLFSMRKQL